MINGPLKIVLFPFALLYGLIIRIRNWLYDTKILRSHEFSIPVISVGNLAVGGTGKTPHVEYLAGLFGNNFNIAVLSRGYKRKTRGFILASDSSTASDIGDEPAQIKQRYPEIVVAVDANRVHGINQIIKLFPDIEVILLDDAFQHRKVDPGISILLTDYNNLFSGDYLMPYGRLREHRSNRRRADFILVTRSPHKLSPIERRIIVGEIPPLSHQHLYFTSTIYKEPVPVFENTTEPLCLNKIADTDRNILLITGIASPSHLFDYISIYSKHILHLKYPDHHSFSIKDMDRIVAEYFKLPEGNRCIITTEKDAVRLKEIPNIADRLEKTVYFIPIGVMFLNDDAEEFKNFINSYVRKNRSNSSIS